MAFIEIPRDQFFSEASEKIKQQVAAELGVIGLKHNDRSNVMELPVTGIKGCHYEIAFHGDCDEIALHFQGTQENNASRLDGFRPHIDRLSAKLGYPLKPDKHENGDRKRLWIKLPPNRICTQELLEKYSDLMARLIIETYPILTSIMDQERRTGAF